MRADGGPAFPSELVVKAGSRDPIRGITVPPNTESVHVFAGMSLRDYFAAKALQGVMSGQTGFAILDDKRPHVFDATASLVYEIADAMIKARGGAS